MKIKKLLTLLALVLMSIGSASAKTDVTSTYLTNGNLSSLTGWTILDNFYTDWETDGDVAAIEFYSEWSGNAGSPWGKTKEFDFSQSPKLPAGYYRLCVNAFYREGNGNGTNTKAYIYAGDKQQYVVGLSSGGVNAYSGGNDLHKAANAFSLGEFSNEFDFQVTEEDAGKALKLGFHGVFNTYCSWCCLGPVTIYEYTVDDYMDTYDEIVDEAELLYDSKMNKTVLANLKAAANKKSTLTTIDELLEACDDLKAAIAEAKASIEMYSKAAALIASIEDNLSEEGQDELEDYIDSYDDGTLADYDAFYAAYVTAFKKYPADGADMTLLITNPQINGSTGWTCTRVDGSNGPLLNNSSFEFWIGTAANGSFDYYQVITGLPNGHYSISADMYNSSNGVAGNAPNGNAGLYGFANNTTKFVGVTTDSEQLTTYTIEDVVVTDGTLRLGVKSNGTMGARWFVADNFTLKFVSGMTDIDAALVELGTLLDQAKELIDADEVATSSLKSTIASDYDTFTAYDENTNLDDIKEASETITEDIAALTASIEAYAKLKTAFTAFEGNDDVATLVTQAKANYEAATMSTDEVLAYCLTFNRSASLATLSSPYTGSAVAEGEFYLYNLASGKFLAGGNDWGTRMSLSTVGQNMVLAGSNGTFTIDSHISNGGDSHFVGNGGYLDAAAVSFTFTNIGNNIYTISWANGANMYGYDGSTTAVATQTAESAGSYWQIISKDEILALALENGSDTNPYEITSLVKDWNFGRNNKDVSAWTAEKSGGNLNLSNGGNWKYYGTEGWNNTFTVKQTLTGLPNGKYMVTAQGFCTNGNAYVFAGNSKDKFDVPATRPDNFQVAAENIGNGMYSGHAATTYVVDSTLVFGVGRDVNTSADWSVFSNIRVFYCGPADDVDVTLASSGYSSFSSEYAVSVPDGLEAYTASSCNGSTVSMKKIEDGIIPANTGVVLYGTPSEAYTLEYYSDNAESIDGNLLVAVAEDLKLDPTTGDNTNYVLSEGEFHPFEGVASVAAGKAYLSVPTTSSAKALKLDFGGIADNIKGIAAEGNGNAAVFNLAGQTVGKNYKGIVIRKGAKVLNK